MPYKNFKYFSGIFFRRNENICRGVVRKFVVVFRVHKALNYIGFKSKCFWEDEEEGVSFSKINILIFFFLIQKNKSLQNMYALECAQIFKHNKEQNATSLWRVK